MNRFVKLLFILLISSLLFSQTTTTIFKFTSKTATKYHTIAIPATAPTINGTALVSGDEIGAFTSSGLCVGAVVWTGATTAITAWPDNSETAVVDGFTEKTSMYFRIYSSTTKKVYYATPVYNTTVSGSSTLFITNGMTLLTSLTGTTVVGVENLFTPDDYKLSQNYPNPFNPSTKINFSIPKSSILSLTIYDLNGKEISKLIDNKVTAAGSSSIEWNGKDLRGSVVSSGLYFYRLDSRNIEDGKIAFTQVKSMILMK
jgi:hypothetical protein